MAEQAKSRNSLFTDSLSAHGMRRVIGYRTYFANHIAHEQLARIGVRAYSYEYEINLAFYNYQKAAMLAYK